MNTASFTTFVVAFVLMAASANAAINCYVCSSCNDPFDKNTYSSYITSCSSGVCQKAKGDVEGVTTVGRTCGVSGATGCTTSVYNGISVNICSCNTELCNSAVSVSRSRLLFGVSTFAAIAAVIRRFA